MAGLQPAVTKCELCSTRLEKGLGRLHQRLSHRRRDLWSAYGLAGGGEQRIKKTPGKYYQERVYGEFDNGGTQSIYLSRVAFGKLGLPELGPESVPARLCAGRDGSISTSRCRRCYMSVWCR